MILDALFAVVAAVIGGVLDLLTSLIPAVPAWLVSALGSMSTVVGWLWALDAWLPVGLALTIAGAVVGAWAAAVVVGLIRWLVSYFTGGGGAT